MKKSSKVTPKELSKKRIATSKLMKIPNNEGKFPNKENEIPPINIKYKTYKIHDRDIKDTNLPNPFDIPDHRRIFSKSKNKGQRKVKPEPFIMSEPHTICDIDSTFYKIIEGRPLRQFTDVKVYMRTIRDITLFKANAAYLKEQILQFDAFNAFEIDEYNQIDKLYETTKTNFVQFAKESYEKAKMIQQLAEVKALEVAKITDQLESFSFKIIKLRNKMSSIMFSFETLSMYGKFLNSLSPAWWREEFDNLNVKHIKDRSVQIARAQSDEAAPSLASIDDYKNSIQGKSPHLFFKKPKQIMCVYDDLSRQCLNYININVFAASILDTVQKSLNCLKKSIKADVNEIESFIQIYESNVKFMEQKEMDYKGVFEKLLFSEFQTLYASPDNTKLFTCVQYVNSRIFSGPEDPKDSVSLLMHGLEMEYIRLTSGLDCLDVGIVNAATSQMFAEDIKMMKRAHFAQRTLKECDILSRALFTSFDPPRTRNFIKAVTKDSDTKDKDKNK